MQLLPASQFSIDVLTHVYNQSRVDYVIPMPMTSRRLQTYIDIYDVALDASVVAVDDDELLGLCMLGLRGDRAWITRLGVLPAARRSGVGRAMLAYMIEQASARAISRVQLEVIVANEAAHGLFLKAGFVDVRRLLILRRPGGAPVEEDYSLPEGHIRWLAGNAALDVAASRPWPPAWTNQMPSLANAGQIEALHMEDRHSGQSGWVTFKSGSTRLKRVIIGPTGSTSVAPARALLTHLHARYPELEAVAENVPASVPHLAAFYAAGYSPSFTRTEMVRELSST